MIAPSFAITGGKSEPHAAVPTLKLGLLIELRDGGALEGMTLFCQARLEPQRRSHSEAEAARLQDLFGARVRWPATMKSLPWVEASLFVPPFERRTEVTLMLPCSYDLEVSAARYFQALEGENAVPIKLLFRGTMFSRGPHGLEMSPLPWSCEASWRMPLQLWRDAVEDVFPDAGWLRLPRSTIDALLAFKGSRALGTWDGVMKALLDGVAR